MSSAYSDEIKLRQKWLDRKASDHKDYAEWRRYYREKGPVVFAEEWLKIDPETGGPIIISEEQAKFLNDLAFNDVKFAILIAGRGGGKSFLLAIYVAWRIFTHDFWGITVMGGSAEQSGKENKYIKFWIMNCKGEFGEDKKEIKLIELAPKPTKKEIWTQSNSYAIFTPCSDTAARGPHPKELLIDEQAAAERAGKGDILETAIGQVSTSTDMHIIRASTAQFVYGNFLKIWDDAEKLGYTRYHWALAKHISGDTDIYKHYHDTDPEMWISNVPWVPTSNIRAFRKQYSDDKFLVEILGGIGKSSGLVFNRDDIELCTCTKCIDDNKPCYPYKEGHCTLIQTMMNKNYGIENPPKSTIEALKLIRARVEGVDWGDVSPCCYTAFGKFKNDVLILHNETKMGVSDDEKVQTAVDIAREWEISIVRPDPREWSYNHAIAKKGLTVHELFSFDGPEEKGKYLYTFKRFIERHTVHIPVVFKDFITCLKQMSFDAEGRVIKKRDHNFDSGLYGISYYGELQDEDDWWKNVKGKSEENKDDSKKEETKIEDRKVIKDWETWAEKDKWGDEKSNPEDEGMDFPWGEGSSGF
jgi:hypothetical protein